MVDLNKEIDFSRDDYALEEFMLFCILVTGKKASTTVKILDSILKDMHKDADPEFSLRPLRLINRWIEKNQDKDLAQFIRSKGVGCHSHKAKAMLCLVDAAINLRTCSIDDLEELYGVGQKTSRFFLMCNRPNVKAAILDRHILKHLADKGYNVPKATPSTKSEYRRIEKIFLQEAEKSGVDPMQFDYAIWKEAAGIS